MRYSVFAYNCYEDFYEEEPFLIASFDSLKDAENFINSNGFYEKTKTFDVSDDIKWFFASCNEKGELVAPESETDNIDCYQMVYIKSENKDDEWESECIAKWYNLDYLGNVEWL